MRLLHLIKMFVFFNNYYGGSQIAKNMKYMYLQSYNNTIL